MRNFVTESAEEHQLNHIRVAGAYQWGFHHPGIEYHFHRTSPEYGKRRQRLIFVQGLGHMVSRVPVDFAALEERAGQR